MNDIRNKYALPATYSLSSHFCKQGKRKLVCPETVAAVFKHAG